MEFSSVRDTGSDPRVRVLPRDEAREHLLAIADMLAKVLDTTVRIPGTSWYIGLDPLVGLIPGIGDVIANLIGTIILGLATRLQLPRIVLARMSLNLLINGAVGAVPIVGDLFSVWFRSHARNAVLLREAAMKPDRETHADWFYVVGIIGGTASLLLLTIAFVVWLVFKIWTMVAGG
ncbi:MAG TPA: DUF4112 domain-containing protein [Nitrospira sp.]|nr:DUF4112 domain-containing protein [Nitrospira sp.]